MNKYGVNFLIIKDSNEEEIGINDMPEEYLNGVIKMCKDEIYRRKRLDRVYEKIADDALRKINE